MAGRNMFGALLPPLIPLMDVSCTEVNQRVGVESEVARRTFGERCIKELYFFIAS